MRPFDIVGIVVVLIWIGSVGAFALLADDEDAQRLPMTDGDIDLREETTWLEVYHEGEEVGIVREDRTRLIDGWLVETQGMAEFDLLGDTTAFRFTSRTTLGEDLTLQSATGSVEAFGRQLDLNGQYLEAGGDPRIQIDVTIDDASQRFVAQLEDRPRLADHALPEILADQELEAGDRYRREFFDPMTFSPTVLEITYKGREVIDTVEGSYNAHDFMQSVGQVDTRIYTDSRGMVLMQALPMDVVVRRIPDQIGPGQFDDYEKRIEESVDESPPFVDAVDARDLLSVVARLGAGEVDRLSPVDDPPDDEPDDDEPAARQFELEPVDDPDALDLIAPRQHVGIQTADRARVEVGPDNPLWHTGHAPANSEYTPVAEPPDSELVAGLTEDLDDIVDTDGDDPVDPSAIQRALDDHCGADLLEARVDFDPGGWPTEPVDEPDDYVECLAGLADAMVAAGLPPHFVHGAVQDQTTTPRVWLALYVDGHYRGDIDGLAAGGAPGADHVQLYLEDDYRPGRLTELVEALEPN